MNLPEDESIPLPTRETLPRLDLTVKVRPGVLGEIDSPEWSGHMFCGTDVRDMLPYIRSNVANRYRGRYSEVTLHYEEDIDVEYECLTCGIEPLSGRAWAEHVAHHPLATVRVRARVRGED